VVLPDEATTLMAVLQWHARRTPMRCHVRLLGDDGRVIETLSHGDLLQRAGQIAGALQAVGVVAGEAVALMLPTSSAFLICFMGILLAGGTPVPLYPPARPGQLEEHLRRQANILDNAEAVLLISDASTRQAGRILKAGAVHLRGLFTVEQLLALARPGQTVERAAADMALVQYTSGSTGQPKGVMLTHANLLANIRAMGQAVRVTTADTFVSWLPLYHDMGLIGAWLGSLYHGVVLVLMGPQQFLGRPSRWLRALSDHRATLTAAPNFAYDIAATRVPDDELTDLDLRSVRAALNGSEPVHAVTLDLFAARFGRHGLNPRALSPVYGLAECSVGLAFSPWGRGPRVDHIDRRTLRERGLALAAPADSDVNAMAVVSCGMALPGHELRVVDEQGAELPDRHEGRIEFRGPSACGGYLHQAEATRTLFRDGWLDTGDAGYVADGELFVTSRIKDLIKRAGHNLHPDDLESAVGALPGVRQGCVAVLGTLDRQSRAERVVVLAETRLTAPAARQALHDRIAALTLSVLGAHADEVLLLPPRSVRKTSSGKIRRAACRELYEQGRIGQRESAPLWQWARLWWQAAGRRIRGVAIRLTVWLWAAWMWGVFVMAAVLGIAVTLWPDPLRRRRMARCVARAGLAVAGLVPEVHDASAVLPGPCVFVCNHASYLDWVVLVAVLPAQVAFVAKHELAQSPVLGWLLSRMGVQFVAREDAQAGVEDVARLVHAARQGQSLLLFAEGTFTRAPGLRPFHLGAFVVATQAQVPVVPVALSGTRSVLRDGSWLPRRGGVVVHIDAALQPGAADWQEAIRLRDAARQVIARSCGEPLLVG
jgi:1-acyl-sn-glycerol-3-phosphate acyltransferase